MIDENRRTNATITRLKFYNSSAINRRLEEEIAVSLFTMLFFFRFSEISASHQLRDSSHLSRNSGDDKFSNANVTWSSSIFYSDPLLYFLPSAMKKFSELPQKPTINGLANRRHCFGLACLDIPRYATTAVCHIIIIAACDEKQRRR